MCTRHDVVAVGGWALSAQWLDTGDRCQHVGDVRRHSTEQFWLSSLFILQTIIPAQVLSFGGEHLLISNRFYRSRRHGGHAVDAGTGASWEARGEAASSSDEGVGRGATTSCEGTKWHPASAVRRLRQTATAARARTRARWTQRRQKEVRVVCSSLRHFTNPRCVSYNKMPLRYQYFLYFSLYIRCIFLCFIVCFCVFLLFLLYVYLRGE